MVFQNYTITLKVHDKNIQIYLLKLHCLATHIPSRRATQPITATNATKYTLRAHDPRRLTRRNLNYSMIPPNMILQTILPIKGPLPLALRLWTDILLRGSMQRAHMAPQVISALEAALVGAAFPHAFQKRSRVTKSCQVSPLTQPR